MQGYTGKKVDRQWTAAEERFWQRYAMILEKKGITGNEARWMVIRAQEYVLANRAVRLRDQSAEQVRRNLDILMGQAHLKDWQRAQAVRAIQILFRDLVGTEWADEFDWDYAVAATRKLPDSHPTIARSMDAPATDTGDRLRVMRKSH